MKYLLDINEYLNEKFISNVYTHKNSQIINPLVDFKGHLIENDENAKWITEYLNHRGYLYSRRFNDCLIKVYHGTHPDIPILKEGIKVTGRKTAHSYQVEYGYTYFSIYPSMARSFGNRGFGINNAIVYECLIPVSEIKPDKDQLNNARHYGKLNPKDSIGDSIVYGYGVRVKGDIPPYMIKIYEE